MLNAYAEMFRRYFDFKSRTSRADYWWAILAYALSALAVMILTGILGELGTMIFLLYYFATLIPAFALNVRRLHDVGRSGWWALIASTGIGSVLMLVWTTQAGQEGDNPYGPNPAAFYGY